MRSGWTLPGLLAALLMAAFIAACSGQAGGPTEAPKEGTSPASLVRRDDGRGGVTVEALWLTPDRMPADLPTAAKDYPADRHVLFSVKLDTHAVDLDKYDLAKAASLTDGDGTKIPAVAWIGINESSHHREGLIAFSGSTNERWAAERRRARLTLADIAEPGDRALTWEW